MGLSLSFPHVYPSVYQRVLFLKGLKCIQVLVNGPRLNGQVRLKGIILRQLKCTIHFCNLIVTSLSTFITMGVFTSMKNLSATFYSLLWYTLTRTPTLFYICKTSNLYPLMASFFHRLQRFIFVNILM